MKWLPPCTLHFTKHLLPISSEFLSTAFLIYTCIQTTKNTSIQTYVFVLHFINYSFRKLFNTPSLPNYPSSTIGLKPHWYWTFMINFNTQSKTIISEIYMFYVGKHIYIVYYCITHILLHATIIYIHLFYNVTFPIYYQIGTFKLSMNSIMSLLPHDISAFIDNHT